jgi:hypothetical protein
MSTCLSPHIKPSVCCCSFSNCPQKALSSQVFRFPPAYHITGYGSGLWISSTVETNIGIIFTCMHAMRPFLARLIPDFFSSPSRVSKNKYSNEKSSGYKASTDPAPTRRKARLNPFASVSGVGKWIAHMDNSKATSFGNADSTVDSVDLNPGLNISAGAGKAKTLITTGSRSGDAPTDSIMYAQEVKVFSEGRK